MTDAEETFLGPHPGGEVVDSWPRPTLSADSALLPPELLGCLDILLLTDARLKVERIEIYPSGFDPYGCTLVELVEPPSRLGLRQAAERCFNSGECQTVVAELSGDLIGPTLLKLSLIDRSSGSSILLSGLSMGEATAATPDSPNRRLENLDRLAEVAPVAMFTKDVNGRFTWANQRLLDLLGVKDLGALLGHDDFEFHSRSQAAKYVADEQQIIKTGTGSEYREEIQTRDDGRVEIIHTSKLPTFRADGTVDGIVGFSTDVTEPARIAKKLQRTEQRYMLAASASRDGVWELDTVSSRVHLSRRAQELLGLEQPEEEISWDQFVAEVGEPESEFISAAIEIACSQPGMTVSHIVEFKSADTTRYVELVASALVDGDEVVALVGTAADVTEDRLREEALIYQAHHDDLTGLQNRRSLIRQIERCIDERTYGSLLYLDLDSFRTVNDSLGHSVGDDLLQAVGERLRSIVSPEALVARIGADEFAVLMVGADSVNSEQTAECIIGAIASPLGIDDSEMYLTASIGIAHLKASSRSAEEIIRDADIALYHAKDDGKACVRVFDERMRQSADDQLALHTRLRQAVERKEFELHYQPIFDSVSSRLVGVEGLIRWNPPGGRQERPNVFLPYLEQTGLIKEVGCWVIDEGCRQLAQWRQVTSQNCGVEGGLADSLYIALNLSRVQFESEDLIGVVTAALNRHNLQPSDLVLEVTETAVSRDPEGTSETLASIQSQGIRVAIDDFGVGESSLSLLYDMPVNIVKIDKSFIDRITDDDDEPIISAVFQIARALGLATVAEGVETEMQRDWLVDQQCDYLQGYLLSTPLPPNELASLWLNPADDAL